MKATTIKTALKREVSFEGAFDLNSTPNTLRDEHFPKALRVLFGHARPADLARAGDDEIMDSSFSALLNDLQAPAQLKITVTVEVLNPDISKHTFVREAGDSVFSAPQPTDLCIDCRAPYIDDSHVAGVYSVRYLTIKKAVSGFCPVCGTAFSDDTRQQPRPDRVRCPACQKYTYQPKMVTLCIADDCPERGRHEQHEGRYVSGSIGFD